jgi:hypothetical protein
MGFVFLWLICGFGCAAIASSKNKSALNWFLLGILTGPLGLLIIGFMKEEDKAPKPNLEATTSDLAWRRMHADLYSKAAEFAGTRFVNKKSDCPECEHPCGESDIICPDCTAWLDATLDATATEEQNQTMQKFKKENTPTAAEFKAKLLQDNQVAETGENTEESKTLLKIEKLEMMGDADALAVLIAEEIKEDICLTAAKALIKLGDKRGDRYLASVESKRIDATKQD